MGLLWSRLVTSAVTSSDFQPICTKDLIGTEYTSYLDKWRVAIVKSGIDLPKEIICIIHAYVTIDSKNEYFIHILRYRELRVEHNISESSMCSVSIILTGEPVGIHLTLRAGGMHLFSGTAESPVDVSTGEMLETIESNKLHALFLTMLERTIATYSDWEPWSAFNQIDLADECNYLLRKICTNFRIHATAMLAFGDDIIDT